MTLLARLDGLNVALGGIVIVPVTDPPNETFPKTSLLPVIEDDPTERIVPVVIGEFG